MKKYTALFFVVFCLSFCAQAQRKIEANRSGYLVRSNGDTLRGKFRRNDMFVKFKENPKAKAQMIYYAELKAYAFDDDETRYHIFNNKIYELLVEGPVSLYKDRTPLPRYSVQTQNQLTERYGVVKKPDVRVTVIRVVGGKGGKNDFRETASEYFKDCNTIVKEIQNGDYDKVSSLPILVDRYNAWLVSRSIRK